MRGNFVSFWLSVALPLALGGLAHAGQIATVQGVAVADDDSGTKALVDVPDGTRYEVFALANPDRLVVDLHDSRLASDFRLPGPDGMVANVRTGEPTPGDVRLVFDLAGKVRPKSYFQQGQGTSRLVIEMPSASARAHARKSGRGEVAATDVAIAPSGPAAKTMTPVSTPVPLPVDAAPTGATLDLPAAVTQTSAASSHQTGTALPSAAPPPVMPGHGMAAESHRDAPRLTQAEASVPPASLPASEPQANADADNRPVVTRPGARTLRDVLGNGQRKIVIAVDAGHGGQDTGAKGYSGTYEKNVTLATARELARQIDATPGMKAVLTRDGDYFVPLADRYHKARDAKADLFISIHCDAEPGHDATGSSVWVLSERGVTSQAARWLADRENAADLVGGVKLSDKDNTLASVLLDLSQSATMKASEDAAERVHQALRDIGRTHKAHPERANFVVLRSPDVPSMLVETAFITNAEEEQRLNDPEYRARLARAVLGGVKGYFIDNPLPGTEFAAQHERGSRNVREAAAQRMAATPAPEGDRASSDTMVATKAAPMELATADVGQQVHVVQRGERLVDIASRYGVSAAKLREVNDLDTNAVHPGQQLLIPARPHSG
ncbi:MAG TPA: N-acetylmuramoyl-L-alanine amidase [Xanthomonadaceae bacterium]|jgi:N-acetylmuramoyl-L-alanine amidase